MVDHSPSKLFQSLQNIYSQKGFFGTAVGVTEYLIPHPYDAAIQMIREEWKKGRSATVPWRKRLIMYRRGFQSYQYSFYNFDDGVDSSLYLAEFPRIAYTSRINDDRSLLDDKAKFYRLLTYRGFDDYLPTVFGRIENGISDNIPKVEVLELLKQENRLVIKPVTGAAGSGIKICTVMDDGIRVNGKLVSNQQFLTELGTIEPALVTEYCKQAQYSAEIYPESANTIRVLTMQPKGEDPFIATAVHRFGSESTNNLDNFSQGGLSAEVNLDTGELSAAAEYLSDGNVRWHDIHPDTHSKIHSINVPGWGEIKKQLLDVMNRLPEFRYVGWDVLVTSPGEFVLLEGNNQSDVDLLQVHQPLLADRRIRDFYREQGVPV